MLWSKLYILDGSHILPWPSLEKARTTAGINLCSVSVKGVCRFTAAEDKLLSEMWKGPSVVLCLHS